MTEHFKSGGSDLVSAAVRRYYDATDIDYRTFWSGKSELAIHFGYFDAATRNHKASLLRMNALMRDCAAIGADDHVIDAGCGFGGSAFWLAQASGCRVTGVNILHDQIAFAKAEADRRGLTGQVDFVAESFEDTGLRAGAFDVFWALESLVHVDGRQAVLAEAARLLKPGGRLVIAEYMLTESAEQCTDQGGAFAELLEGWAMPRLYYPSDYIEQAQACGLHNTANHDISENVRPSFNRLRKLVWIGLKVGRFLKRLHLYNADRLRHSEASRVLIETFDQGLWRYRVLVFEKRA